MVARSKSRTRTISQPTQALTHNVDTLLLQVEAEECRRSLKAFTKACWHIVEPGTPFVDGMPIDAMVQHLEALTWGDLKRLLINIPPRCTKSTIGNVIWPVWHWLHFSSHRFLSSSYSLDLSTRDNRRKRVLVESSWFQDRYASLFSLADDQQQKRFFENSHKGYQMAVSVGGAVTGQGGDILLCLCYNAEVTTDKGRLCIGDIVENRLPVQVLAFDHATNTARWQNIDKYESSPGRACVRVTFSDGRTVEATADHPFYVVGRGYISAAQLTNKDEVVTDESFLRSLQQGSRTQALSSCSGKTSLLQQCLSQNLVKRRDLVSHDSFLRGVWKGIYPQTCNDKKLYTSFLQQSLLRYVAEGRRSTDQSCLRDLWQGNLAYSIRPLTSRTRLLQPSLSLCANEQDNYTSRSKPSDDLYLRDMWKRIRALSKPCEPGEASFLQPSLSWRVGTRREQSCLSWWENRTLLQGMWKNIYRETLLSSKVRYSCKFLFADVPVGISSRQPITSLSQFIRQLRILWGTNEDNKAESRKAQFLFSQMCESITQRIYEWREQSSICRWYGDESISSCILGACAISSRTRRESMQALSDDERGTWSRVTRSSYQLRHTPQRTFKPRIALQVVSREDAWYSRAKIPVETLLVRCVESIPTPERVYNLQVAEDHNYFANGVLVHNCDDPHSATDAHSDADRESALRWFREVWTNRLNSQENGRMLVIGQRVHDNDVSGYILHERPDWVHLNLPAYYEPDRKCVTPIWSDPRTEEGQLLWPERFSKETLEGLKRDLGSMGFAAQYQQRPVPSGGGQFKKAWFRYFTQEDTHYCLETPETIKRVLAEQCQKIITVDLAISQKQSADYTVISTWAVTPDREILLIDCLRDHLDNPEQQKQIQLLYQRYHPAYICVENVAYQLAIIQQLLRLGLPTKEYKPVKDKVSRASTAAVLYEAGRVYHPRTASWLTDWEDELLIFPMGAHDDMVDCTSMICDLVSGPNASSSDHLEAMKRRVELAKTRTVAPAWGGITR